MKTDSCKFKLSIKLFMAVFCAGELIGALSFNNEALRSTAEVFFRNRISHTFIETLLNSFSGAFLLVLACLMLGVSAAFMPIIPAVPFFHGLGVGVMLAGMNADYGIRGTLISLIFVLPFAVLSAMVVIAAAKESFAMSGLCIRVLLGEDKSDIGTLKLYFTKFLALFALLAVLSLADSLVTYFFAGTWSAFMQK